MVVGDVGRGIDIYGAHGPKAARNDTNDKEDDHQLVSDGVVDDFPNHAVIKRFRILSAAAVWKAWAPQRSCLAVRLKRRLGNCAAAVSMELNKVVISAAGRRAQAEAMLLPGWAEAARIMVAAAGVDSCKRWRTV